MLLSPIDSHVSCLVRLSSRIRDAWKDAMRLSIHRPTDALRPPIHRSTDSMRPSIHRPKNALRLSIHRSTYALRPALHRPTDFGFDYPITNPFRSSRIIVLRTPTNCGRMHSGRNRKPAPLLVGPPVSSDVVCRVGSPVLSAVLSALVSGTMSAILSASPGGCQVGHRVGSLSLVSGFVSTILLQTLSDHHASLCYAPRQITAGCTGVRTPSLRAVRSAPSAVLSAHRGGFVSAVLSPPWFLFFRALSGAPCFPCLVSCQLRLRCREPVGNLSETCRKPLGCLVGSSRVIAHRLSTSCRIDCFVGCLVGAPRRFYVDRLVGSVLSVFPCLVGRPALLGFCFDYPVTHPFRSSLIIVLRAPKNCCCLRRRADAYSASSLVGSQPFLVGSQTLTDRHASLCHRPRRVGCRVGRHLGRGVSYLVCPLSRMAVFSAAVNDGLLPCRRCHRTLSPRRNGASRIPARVVAPSAVISCRLSSSQGSLPV